MNTESSIPFHNWILVFPFCLIYRCPLAYYYGMLMQVQ